MKKITTSILLISMFLNAHGQLKIVGSNIDGAAGSIGSIYEFDLENDQLDILYEPGSIHARNPRNNDMVLGNDGLYYGVSTGQGFGVMFSWDPLTDEYITLYENASQLGGSGSNKIWTQPLAYDQSNQVIFTNNRLEVSKYDITTGVGEIIYTLSNDYVADHNVIYHDNKLWGTRFNFSTSNFEIYSYDLVNETQTMHYALASSVQQGGFRAITLDGDYILGSNRLGAFRFNTLNDQYEQLFTCTVADGRLFNEPLRVGNKLYMTATEGGDNNAGVLLAYDFVSDDYEVLHHFDTYGPSTSNIGGWGGYRIIENNGTLLFTTRLYGANEAGTLLSYEISTETLTKVIDFDSTAVEQAYGALALDEATNSIYGLSWGGGAIDVGTLFSYSLSTEEFATRLNLGTYDEGIARFLSFQVLKQGTLFGIGANELNQILLYSFDMNNQEITILHNFGVTSFQELRINEDRVLLARSVNGEIITYTFDLVTSQFEEYSFTHSEISTISALEVVGDDIYFANELGGTYDFGFIGKHNKLDNTTDILHSFTETENDYSFVNSFEYFDQSLYFSSDNSSGGMLHAYDLNTSTHSTLVELDITNSPELGALIGRITIEDNQIFGSTFAGGDNDLGVIFQCDLNGNNWTVLYDYQLSNLPNIAKPLFKKGDFLVGYNYQAAWPVGTVEAQAFMLDINSGSFEVLYSLDYNNTGIPMGNNNTNGGFLFVYDQCELEDYSVTQIGNTLSLDLPNQASIEWVNCNDEATTISSGVTFTPTVSGEYKALVSLSTCETETDCINVQLLNTNNYGDLSNITLYPNPSNDIVTIDGLKDFSSVTIHDALGKLIRTYNLDAANTLSVNVNGFEGGMYFVKINNEQTTITKRLMVK
ncbi:MAG: T9SS type A sorting domain-containing protein [Crocinitomicaceae bacterium]|nr:T9SS type A sorting domain-containing protein [Crocinitomicaceae bacterium]